MYYKLVDNGFLKVKPNEKMLSVILEGSRGDVVINEAAFDILKYCDGSHTLEDICKELGEIYSNPEQYTGEFLEQYVKKGIVQKIDFPSKNSVVKGDERIYYPDVIIWEITNRCPLNCIHCYLGEKDGNELELDGINKVLSLVKKTGVTGIQLTGGEIFLHPNLEYIIDQINCLDIPLVLSTSGYILNEEVKRIIKKLKKTAVIRVSLDGNSITHNKIRRNEKAYKNCIDFIEYLRRQNITCQVATTLINQKDTEIRELIMMVRDLGVGLLEISNVLEEGDALINKQSSLYKQEELNKKLYEWYSEFATETFKIKLPGKESVLSNCGCGYKLIYLKPDLSITPCPLIPYKIGSLDEEKYNSIMLKGTNIFMDIVSPKQKNQRACHQCPDSDECGSCIAMALIKENKTKNCSWINENKLKIEQLLG